MFLERLCTAGILVILPLFFHNKLGLEEHTSTSLFHIFDGFTFLFTIVGAIISDLYFGLFKSIIVMSFLYLIGLGTITIGLINPLNLPIELFVSIGLVISVIGCGCIKAPLSVFGGNQHKLPEKERELQIYFSAQLFASKCGSFLARVSFPILRASVSCFGNKDCYSLTFGTAMIILLLATISILCGSAFYTHVPANGNVLVKVFKCIFHALVEKMRHKREGTSVDQHWLSYAKEKYGRKLVLETKVTLKVLVMFIPIPMFWGLHLQQMSRWIFQASQMNGDIGIYKVKPEQMMAVNSLLIIILIPSFERFIYPLLRKIGITTMLQRIIIGLFFAIVAFLFATIVEMEIKTNYISILWQLPQFFTMATAEIFTFISHLNFAYQEAPKSMKPVMVGFMYLSEAGGNAIIAIISGIRLFESQTYEYMFFAFLMLLDVILLCFLARNFKSTDHERIEALGSEELNGELKNNENNKV